MQAPSQPDQLLHGSIWRRSSRRPRLRRMGVAPDVGRAGARDAPPGYGPGGGRGRQPACGGAGVEGGPRYGQASPGQSDRRRPHRACGVGRLQTEGERRMTRHIDVLDHGYVRLVDVMGSDLSVVNAARVSFAKESAEFDEQDERLIRFLAREGHTSPFRHAMATFEAKAPLMVARQWWKYVVGSDHTMESWNEASRRYVTMEPELYVPERWRNAPESRKQGSDGAIEDDELNSEATAILRRMIVAGVESYEALMAEGIAPEQARLCVPAYAMYTAWRWTASLQSVTHFLAQRLADDSQWEIQQYARAVYRLIEPEFPVSIRALVKEADAS